MSGTAFGLPLTADVRDGLSDLAREELQVIVDGVRTQYAGAPVDAVVAKLVSFQRVRQLDAHVVQRLAEAISAVALPVAR